MTLTSLDLSNKAISSGSSSGSVARSAHLIDDQLFTTALSIKNLTEFYEIFPRLIDMNKDNRHIFLIEIDSGTQMGASLSIDFLNNTFTTGLECIGKDLESYTGKLSCALANFQSLLSIFQEYLNSMQNSGEFNTSELEADQVVVTNEQSSECSVQSIGEAIEKTIPSKERSVPGASKFYINGKERIAFYPSTRRVVLEQNRSVPLAMMQQIVHFFNPHFTKLICSELGISPTVTNLLQSVRKIYIRACIIGLWKSIHFKRFTDDAHLREFHRIAALIKFPQEYCFYTTPLVMGRIEPPITFNASSGSRSFADPSEDPSYYD